MVRLSITIEDNEALDMLADEIRQRCDYDMTREEVLKILPDYFRVIAERTVELGLQNGLNGLDFTSFEKILRKLRRL